MKELLATIGAREWAVAVDHGGRVALADGAAALRAADPDGFLEFEYAGQVYRARAVEREGVWYVELRDRAFVVQVQPAALKSVRAAQAAGGAQTLVVRAPMPGLVRGVEVSVGDAVQKDQVLVRLEAMKMESHFRAPAAGMVTRVGVAPGETVEAGKVLVEMKVSA